MNTTFLLGSMKGRDNFEDLCVNRRVILKRVLGEKRGKLWTVCIWLRAETSGGLL
jgi:hypothetical protein